MVFEMGGMWLYSCCFVRCCFQDLLNIACSTLVQLPSRFFSIHLVNKWCIHIAVWTWLLLLGKNCVLFHWIGLTSIWLIAYTITLRNKFDALREISETLTPNDKYENFVNIHMEVVTECITTKLRAKHRVSIYIYI